jgi:hypothetical protein
MRIKIGLGILCMAGTALTLSAQSSQSQSTTPGSTQMSTTPRPDSGMSTDTSRSTRPGMANQRTPGAGMSGSSANMHAPMMASDCTNDGWRGYASPKFKSEKACQSYVQKHMKKGTSSETNAPKPDMSSGTGANTGTTNSTQPKPTPHS